MLVTVSYFIEASLISWAFSADSVIVNHLLYPRDYLHLSGVYCFTEGQMRRLVVAELLKIITRLFYHTGYRGKNIPEHRAITLKINSITYLATEMHFAAL